MMDHLIFRIQLLRSLRIRNRYSIPLPRVIEQKKLYSRDDHQHRRGCIFVKRYVPYINQPRRGCIVVILHISGRSYFLTAVRYVRPVNLFQDRQVK
jgi:hypothetical protein